MAQTTITSYEEKEEKGPQKLIRKSNPKGGPFKCCYELTIKETKKMAYKGIEYGYDIWQCNACKKEYFDSEQAKKMEKFWMVEKLLDEKLLSIKRKMNFDGKAFFFRFPKEFTEKWEKDLMAEIKVINPETFLVEIGKG